MYLFEEERRLYELLKEEAKKEGIKEIELTEAFFFIKEAQRKKTEKELKNFTALYVKNYAKRLKKKRL